MIHVAGEVIIIILCVIHRILKNLKKPINHKNQTKPEQAAISIKQSQPIKKNTQLEELQIKKKQIQSTMQQFNTPSTFAKYSKMKRQLLKLQAKINQVKQKNSQESQIKLTQKTEQPKTPQVKTQSIIQTKNQHLLPAWFGVFFNIVIMCLSYTLETSVLPNHEKFPLSFFTNQTGRANCILIYFACKMLMS